MNRKVYILVTLSTFSLLTTACKRKIVYECQCYNQAGILTNKYEIGQMDGKLVGDRCLAIQQQNIEFSCQGSGSLK